MDHRCVILSHRLRSGERATNMEWKCKKCNSEKLKVLQSGDRTGVYSAECGAWVRWLKRKVDVREAYSHIIQEEDIRGKAVKRIVKYGRLTTIRCEKCDCLLYSSNVGAPLGQFDLIDASYCPKCGVEFIDEHKTFSKK